MHRLRVLRDIQRLGDLAGGKAFGFVTHQKAEGVEARGLGKRAQRDDDRFVIHISTIADIWIWCNRRHGENKQPPARPDHPRKRDRLPAAEIRSAERSVGKEWVRTCRYR